MRLPQVTCRGKNGIVCICKSVYLLHVGIFSNSWSMKAKCSLGGVLRVERRINNCYPSRNMRFSISFGPTHGLRIAVFASNVWHRYPKKLLHLRQGVVDVMESFGKPSQRVDSVCVSPERFALLEWPISSIFTRFNCVTLVLQHVESI